MISGKNDALYTIAELCRALEVTRQGYRKHILSQTKPYKHAKLVALMQAIIEEDPENSNYGRERMHDALLLKGVIISLSTVYRVMKEHGLLQTKEKPKGLTKADKLAHKSDNLLCRDFTADEPNKKLVSDITQLPTADGNLYISGIFDCFDNHCLGLSMADNMRTSLVIESLENAKKSHAIRNSIFHTDRGSQYTSGEFRMKLMEFGVMQSMNSDGGRCHDNAKCESMWARFKAEAIYGIVNTKKMSMDSVKSLVFRYFMSYWNNRRICHAIGGTPPAMKRRLYFESQKCAA